MRKGPGSVYDKLFLVLWFTSFRLTCTPPKSIFHPVSAICRHIIGVFNIFVFLIHVLKQYTNLEILAASCIWQEKSFYLWASDYFYCHGFIFFWYFYVYRTIHFSDRKWYFLWTWKCKKSIATIYFWNREIKFKVKSGERGYNCSVNNWLFNHLLYFYVYALIYVVTIVYI